MANEEIMDAEYESINMVHKARKGKPVTTAIAVPIEQARRLLTAEADLQQLRLQVEQEEIARTMEHQRMEARKEINRVLCKALRPPGSRSGCIHSLREKPDHFGAGRKL